MKLLYDLPPDSKKAVELQMLSGEKIMYCLPFNIEGNKFVSDGFTVITDLHIFKVLANEVIYRREISKMTDFATETHYGSCGFYAKYEGNTELICRFITARHMPRYTVIAKACQLLGEKASKDPITDSEPELFCEKCGRPFVKNTRYCPFCHDKKAVYKKLWAMTKGLRLMMLFPLIAVLLASGLKFILPAIQKIAINNYITNPTVDINNSKTLTHFIAITLCIISMDIFQRIISVIQTRIAGISSNRFAKMFRIILFEKIQTLSMSSIQKKSPGDLMSRINNDITVVQNFITQQLPTYFSQVFSFVFALVILLFLDPFMCLFVFIPLPLAIFSIVMFRKVMSRRDIKSWYAGIRMDRKLQDVLNGVKVVKSYGREDDAVEEFTEANAEFSRQSIRNFKLYDTFFSIVGFVVRFGNYLIMLYGNLMLFGGTMTVGELNQFNSYASIIYEPLMQITAIPRSISVFNTSLTKIFEILEEEPEVADIDLPIDIRIEGDVSIKNVSFGYDSYKPVLDNISFDVKQGEMIGIVGHSGCGKSTLINLIMRLYDVSSGEILIDDVNIKDISQSALRGQMGVVLQETHLFAGTIRDNIKYAAPFASNEDVIRAAKLANAHEFIMSMPEGYNTIVGEKGSTLSGGERQRIAIARALIHDPRILILDEATAALDTETEKQIQDAIDRVVENRTTFVIAHRLSTLRNADKLVVIDHGKLAEFGTHRELLDMKGIYYKLVTAQQKAILNKMD